MKMSPQGLAALAQFEGLKTKAYRDSVGVWTIGVGHTAMAGPPTPAAGMVITRDEALEILARDVPQYEAAVTKRLPDVPQNVFDGAVSFCFNLGAGNFAKASWAAKYAAGQMDEAEASFRAWNKARGKVLAGLTTRRAREADMIFRNRYPAAPPKAAAPASLSTEGSAMPHNTNPLSDVVQAIGAKAFDAVVSASPALAIGGAVIKAALDKPHVQIEFKDVPSAAAEVVSTIANSKAITLAPVKSAFESKINWLNGGALSAAIGALGMHIPTTPEGWAAQIGAILVPLITIALKTWFSPSVTAASAGK